MGLPVASTKITVYALNGFCAALAGIVATLYTGSGNPSMGIGLELDAIAVVVIGGTLLAGGRGHLLGTLLGLLIFGTIQLTLPATPPVAPEKGRSLTCPRPVLPTANARSAVESKAKLRFMDGKWAGQRPALPAKIAR
ncbi:MAG: hypothetical protein EXS27_11645 [Pedosphaera sp.]|nr:hypothetical protein [Pedosphaera sp.]